MQFIRRLPILCAHIGTRLLLHVGTRNLNLSSSITSLSQVECDFLFLFFFFRPITIYQFSCSHKLCRLAQRCHVLYILPKKYRQLARSHFILDSLAKYMALMAIANSHPISPPVSTHTLNLNLCNGVSKIMPLKLFYNSLAHAGRIFMK